MIKSSVTLTALLSSLALSTPNQTAAAEFVVLPDSTTLVMLGEIVPNDVDTLSELLQQGISDIIISSPGGSLQAAWDLGELIQARSISLSLPDGAICASACAIMFLHGVGRQMGSSAQIGFHLPRFNSSGGYEDLCRQTEILISEIAPEFASQLQDRFDDPFEYEVSHIGSRSHSDAMRVIGQLDSGASFDSLVLQQPETAASRFFPQGLPPGGVDIAELDLHPGEISPPIETPYGWFIIRLDGAFPQLAFSPADCFTLTLQLGALEFARVSRLLESATLPNGNSEEYLREILTTPSDSITWIGRQEALDLGVLQEP